MSKISEYNKYLKSIHSKKQTPDEIIRSFIKEGTGKDIISKRKIIAGEVNEVYEINLNDGSSLILRIAPNNSNDFLKEKWASSECSKVGVPVPRIILIKDIILNKMPQGFCLMEKVDGDTLERGKINFNDFTLEEKKNYIHQAGEILSKIHSITTTGWGWIIKDRGEYDNSNKLFEEWLNKKESYEKIAREENIENSVIKNVFKLIKRFENRYTDEKPCLNHADFANKHFMVKSGKIITILDWGSARSDLPIYDFASWDFWFGEDVPTEWLKDGYLSKGLFDSHFDDFLHFIRITRGLENLEWYNRQKNRGIIEMIKGNLINDVGYFYH